VNTMGAKNIRKFKHNGEDFLTLPAETARYVELKAWLEEIASELALEPKLRRQLLIAADEIFTNIASYGYPSGDGMATVAVEFDMDDRALTMTFTDNGVEYNPLEVPPPDVTLPMAERTVGGLGIFIVRKIMDEVAYRRENGTNVLVMKKRVGA